MFKVFICGSGNFEKEENEPWRISSQRRSKSCRHPSNHHAKTKNSSSKKNPYSSRGLDKFATVLAELDEKRRKIYEQLGSPDGNLVRFGYSTSKEWVPIVVKLKEQREQQKTSKKKTAPVIKEIEPASKEVEVEKSVVVEEKTNKKSFTGIRPQICLLLVLVLILLCLVISGKSLAILCTSIGWYLLPLLKEKQGKKKRLMNNKDYGRWLSEKKKINPPIEVKSFKRGYSNRNW